MFSIFDSLMPCILVFRTRVYYVFDASILMFGPIRFRCHRMLCATSVFELFDMYMFNSEVGRNVVFDVFRFIVIHYILYL